jgi:hypothetical protein
MDLNKKDNENDNQYIYRLCEEKENGFLEMNWDEVGDTINKGLFGDNIDLYRTSSAYRKPYQYAKEFYKDVFSYLQNDEYITLLDEKEEKIKKEIIKLRDERNDEHKRIRFEARLEDKLDKLEEKIKDSGKKDFNVVNNNEQFSENDLLVILSDIHIGSEFSSFLGRYNSTIAKERLELYASKIISLQKLYDSENCFISLQGDLISGFIHKSVTVSNRENLIEQIQLASELISSFIYSLSLYFKNIYVYSVSGNHSRLEKK